jgi:hypothetical protein
MNPDVATAVCELEKLRVLTPEQGKKLLRIARGELLSVYRELRFGLYLGVALITAGVALLVQQNLERLGPVSIALGLGIAAASCHLWVARHRPPFTWSKAESTHIAFDYVVLLGVLLASADLAYVEAQFTPLGPNWPWHLLIVSLFMALVAFRFDSRILFSLALSTFASWRGVSVSFLERGFWSNFETAARLNTAVSGFLFALLGAALARGGKKAHFAPVATYLGWTLLLLALASGALADDPFASVYTMALLAMGAGLAVHSFRGRRFPLFAMGASATYVALSRWVVPALDGDTLIFLWFLGTSLASIALLLRVHHTLGKRP